MKKVISMVIALVILLGSVLSLSGCGSESEDPQLKAVLENVDALTQSTAKGDSDTIKAVDELMKKVDALIKGEAAQPEDNSGLLAGFGEKIAKLSQNLDKQSALEKEYKAKIAELEQQLSAAQLNAAKIAELEQQIKELTEKLTQKAPEYVSYASEAYEKVKYIDAMLSDRDIYTGENFVLCQKWIHTCLLQAGYQESDIEYQDVVLTKYVSAEENLKKAYPAVKSITTDGKTYSRSGRSYVEDEAGTYTKATMISQNIIVTKKGNSEKQIIIGMHYDGDGTGDNGSGIALGLTTAEKFCKVSTPYTLKFVFFTGEEYGMLGSSVYAQSLSPAEIADTLYMINMDSLICGDYCYLYGGVQDDDTKTVSATGAYDNAMKIAQKLGLEFKSNPWTWDNLSPDDEPYGIPSYASPSTGNWSDHAPFVKVGIPYLYFEATNWDIPDYTGYGETYLIGMLMNTKNDYLDYIEQYFPGRPMHHLEMFSTLLNELLVTEY